MSRQRQEKRNSDLQPGNGMGPTAEAPLFLALPVLPVPFLPVDPAQDPIEADRIGRYTKDEKLRTRGREDQHEGERNDAYQQENAGRL